MIRKHVKSGHYRPASETPSEWRFASGPIVAREHLRVLRQPFYTKNGELDLQIITALTCLKEIKDCNFSVSISYVDLCKENEFPCYV